MSKKTKPKSSKPPQYPPHHIRLVLQMEDTPENQQRMLAVHKLVEEVGLTSFKTAILKLEQIRICKFDLAKPKSK